MAKNFMVAVGVAVALGFVAYTSVYAGPAAAPDLTGKSVAVMVTEGFHDGETLVPIEYLEGGGATITIIGPETGEVTAYNSDTQVTIARTVSEVSVDDFDALVIPGGRSPAALRAHEEVLEFVQAFMASGKPVAAICHGPQVLVTAGVLEGRTLTGVGGIEEEIVEAGGAFDAGTRGVPFTVVDGNLITGRAPIDLPPFCERLGEALVAES